MDSRFYSEGDKGVGRDQRINIRRSIKHGGGDKPGRAKRKGPFPGGKRVGSWEKKKVKVKE